MYQQSAVYDFLALFSSNDRYSGTYNPQTQLSSSRIGPITDKDVIAHFDGTVGICADPLRGDRCSWFSIYVRRKREEDHDLAIHPIAEKVEYESLKLIPTRSVDGGVMLFGFLREEHSAANVRALAARWKAQLGLPRGLIYPSQSRTSGIGALAHLPYLGADATQRYGFSEGRMLSLNGFIATAKSLLITRIADELERIPIVPVFRDLTKHLHGRRARWSLMVDGHLIDGIHTDDLMSWGAMRSIIANEMTRVVPGIAQVDWEFRLHELMLEVRVVDETQLEY